MSLIAEQLGFDFFFASEVQRTEDTAKKFMKKTNNASTTISAHIRFINGSSKTLLRLKRSTVKKF